MKRCWYAGSKGTLSWSDSGRATVRRLLIIVGLLVTFCVAAPAAAAAAKIQHVVWVVMENHGYGSIIGSSSGAVCQSACE